MRTCAWLLAGFASVTPDAADELAHVFTRAPGDRRERAELVAQLADVGRGERERLVRLALGGEVEALLRLGPGTSWIVAPESWPGLAGEALQRLSAPATCEALAHELGAEPPQALRRAALRLLVGLESSACSELAWRLFRGQDPLALATPAPRGEALAALTAAFRLDGASAAEALAAVLELQPIQAELVLAALGASGRSELVEGLEVLLEDPRGPSFPSALAALAELERRAPQELGGRCLAAFEEVAPWMEPGERAAHLLRLAECEEPEFVPLLQELADVPEERTRRLALAAWQTLARSVPAADPAERAAWHARELEWHATRLEPALAEFAGADPAVAVRALHECLRHPLFRRELAGRLAGALIDARAEAALAAMPALAAWGSFAALPGLELALDARSSEVRALAAETLTLLTGERLLLPE